LIAAAAARRHAHDRPSDDARRRRAVVVRLARFVADVYLQWDDWAELQLNRTKLERDNAYAGIAGD